MLTDNFVTMEIGKAKHIALVAHDGKKKELIEWCDRNKEVLQGHFLCGTGTTARLIAEKTGLPVKGYCSGPLGGDQQIGAKIVRRTDRLYDLPVGSVRGTAARSGCKSIVPYCRSLRYPYS